LDGYPIYGYDEPDGKPVKKLDAFNGHADAHGTYHYHATPKYPYLNGGFYGEITERDGGVEPQPRARPLRPALPPLRGAKVTDFVTLKPGMQKLAYEIDGLSGSVTYTMNADSSVAFEFASPGGKTTTQRYAPDDHRPGAGGRSRRDERPRGGRPRRDVPPRNAKEDRTPSGRPSAPRDDAK
jgi:hypothetical protein